MAESTADFVYSQLAEWRDRPGRKAETDEELLNAQLTRHLNGAARRQNFPVIFQHEEKQTARRQTARRRVDIAATPVGFEGAIVGSTYFSFDDAFLVLEGKRLPPPGGKSRKREYVTGEPETTGGIQRFKLGLHGAKLDLAILVGYVQGESCAAWHRRVNVWIRALARRRKAIGRELWEATETLAPIVTATCRTGRCTSEHPRSTPASNKMRLVHMWIEM